MKPLALLTILLPLTGHAASIPITLKEGDGWALEEPALVLQEGAQLELQRKGETSGAVRRELDLSAFEGKKLSLTFEAAVQGGVTPWFEVRSLDGDRSFVAGGLKLIPTDLLTEHNRFGWYYDHRYGWPVNPDLPHLFRRDWQQVGGVFTVPEGVRRVALRLRPRPVKYGLIDRRPEAPRDGSVTIRNLKIEPVAEALGDASPWAAEKPDQSTLLVLSAFHNQQQIALSHLQWKLWRLKRQSRDRGLSEGKEAERLQKALDAQRAGLAGLAEYYHQRFPAERQQIDLTPQLEKYPQRGPDGSLIDIGGRRPSLISLVIEDLLASDFNLQSPQADALAAATAGLAKEVAALEKRILSASGAVAAPELESLSYLNTPALLPPDGKTPAVLFATGNTTAPIRIYKDLGIDLFSRNYPVSTFDEKSLLEDQHLPALLKRYGMRQISCLFTPVHGLFAVSDEFLKAHQGRWREFLREEAPGVAAIHARDRKSGKRDVLKLNLDEFTPEEGKAYILPINPLSPMGREMLMERMQLVRAHALRPENKEVLAALELSAEPTGVVGITSEAHTRAAFLAFLQKEAGDIEGLNVAYGTRLASLEELVDTPKDKLPPRLGAQRYRWERKFRTLGDSQVYHDLQASTGLKDVSFLHRNNDLYFSDFAWQRVKLKDNFVNYHASWDRVYGYDLARGLKRDHITGEDHPALPTGLKDRHSLQQAIPNILKSIWGYGKWGTKVIQIWRPYWEPAYHSAATADSDYTILNTNWTFLPVMREYMRRLGAVIDGEVATRKVAYLQLREQGHITWYVPSVYTTNQYLRRQQVPYAYLFEEALEEGQAELKDYRVLFVPPSLFVGKPMQERLLEWVKEGGQLVLFGPLGLHDTKALPASWLMDEVFGTADYRLVGRADQIRRPNQEGIWAIRWMGERPERVKVTPIANSDLPLPAPKAALFEKKWNDFADVQRVPASETVDPATMTEALYSVQLGKGKVILIPRELLPNAYQEALTAELGDSLSGASWARADLPSFDLMRRRTADDAKTHYLVVQNEDEWQGARTATISLDSGVEAVEDISDLANALPVSLRKEGGELHFPVTLEPGEIATFRLRISKGL